jgi:hypothetical protein
VKADGVEKAECAKLRGVVDEVIEKKSKLGSSAAAGHDRRGVVNELDSHDVPKSESCYEKRQVLDLYTVGEDS